MSSKLTNTNNTESVVKLSESSFYRGYSLVYRSGKGIGVGEVFNEGVRVAYSETPNNPFCLQHLRDIVDDLILKRIAERSNALPSINEFANAIRKVFQSLSLSEKQLLTYLQEKGQTVYSLEELIIVTQCHRTIDVSLMLANLGRLICDSVGFEPPTPIDGRDPFIAVMIEPSAVCSNEEKTVTLRLTTSFMDALKALDRPLE